MPGRRKKGEGKEANYYEFEKAVKAGFPLQLHIGGHAEEFLSQSNILLRDLVNLIKDAGVCKLPDETLKRELYDRVVKAEDRAFKLTAAAESPWIARPGLIKKAESFVLERNPHINQIQYPKI